MIVASSADGRAPPGETERFRGVHRDADREGLAAARRWDEKAGLQARYPSVPINNELYWLNGGQP